jgi:SAM-dependent methyltransferase
MTTAHDNSLRIHDFLDHHDPDLVLAAFRDRQGGPEHMRRIGAMARAIAKSGARPRRVLDLFCGAGDLGRTLALLEPECQVDFVDPDPFSLALAARINRRRRIEGRLFCTDLWDVDWAEPLCGGYDVIAVSEGLCRLDKERAAEVLEEIALLLADGGQLVLAEPTPRAPSASGEHHQSAHWDGFFRRLDRHLGRSCRRGLVTSVPPGRHPIDDDGLPVRDYVRLLSGAGFAHTEVVARDARHVCIRAVHEVRNSRAA